MNPFVYILLGLAAAFLAMAAVILVRTFRFKPKEQIAPSTDEEIFDTDRTVSNLQALIKCKTVSYYKREVEDEVEFKKLLSLLPELYPEVVSLTTYPPAEAR